MVTSEILSELAVQHKNRNYRYGTRQRVCSTNYIQTKLTGMICRSPVHHGLLIPECVRQRSIDLFRSICRHIGLPNGVLCKSSVLLRSGRQFFGAFTEKDVRSSS